MEELYQSVIPNGNIHCLDWSVLNLLAVSVSINKKDLVGEGFGSSKTNQLLVLDVNRPWEYHCVYGDNKSSTKVCKWSPDGQRLLSVEHDGIARVWRMKDKCINSWARTDKVELEKKHLHAGWVEYRQSPNVDFNKKSWPERYECPAHSSYIHMVCPHALIFVYASGKVSLVSFHDNDSVTHSLNLDVEGNLVAVKTMSASNGSILCVVCCGDGLIKLFTLDIEPSSEQKFCITSSLSTSFHPTGGAGGLMTDLVMHPQMGGCSLHICYDDTNLLLWSLRDIDGSYQVKKESLEVMPEPVTSICCTSICQCISECGMESAVTTPVGEFLLEVEREDRKKWPVELTVMAHRDGSTTIMNRNTYQVLYTGKVVKDSDSCPASKRARYETDRSSHASPLSLCVSPNGCCVAFTVTDTIIVHSLCPFILGEKNFSPPEISRWDVLLALATIKGNSVWDIAVMSSRVALHNNDPDLIHNILKHWTEDYMSHANHMTDLLIHQYYTTCATLYCCLEVGMTHSLDQRDVARLHAIASLLFLSFPTSTLCQETTPTQLITDCCSSGEINLDIIIKQLSLKDFVIPQEVCSKLQSHAHWVIEIAIKYASRIFLDQTQRIPDTSTLRVLQRCLLLLYVWNKSLPRPVVNVADSSLVLLFKVITTKINNLALDEVLKSELSKSLPTENDSNVLTLTKASYLLGFLNGLSTTRDLPEMYYRDRFPRLRPHVQAHFPAADPYSPLGLVVPKGLVPPWRDVFVDGHYDIVRGCVLMKSVLKNSRLLQCSSCRAWSLPYITDNEPHPQSFCQSNPTHQWQHGWTGQCVCGSSWTNHIF